MESKMAEPNTSTLEDFNENVKRAQYAVRGPLVVKAIEIKQKLSEGADEFPFDKVIMCNIGNPHAVGQQPFTFHRQVLAGCLCPPILEQNIFPSDVVERCRSILAMTPCGSIGAYTHSQGFLEVRREVANFIQKRDGDESPTDPANVFLTNGASQGIQNVLKWIIRDANDGILVSVPQYPLYSATITLLGGTRMDYYLEEERGWAMNIDHIRDVIGEGIANGTCPRAIVVINPSNPTGSCLTRDDIEGVIRLAKECNLFILADEVYQENVYGEIPFVSFRSVLKSLGPEFDCVPLFSFHSCSKGVLGECGLRGGYAEFCNISKPAVDEFYKLTSIGLCANTIGQIMVYCLCNRPKEGDESYPVYAAEFERQLNSLKERAAFVSENLNNCEGISCQSIVGAMYAFPQITLPPAFVQECVESDVRPDFRYCMELLTTCGICVVPGSGFGQKDGTFHFRTTILPPQEDLAFVVEKMAKFHSDLVAAHS